jgi:hypothetical protein
VEGLLYDMGFGGEGGVGFVGCAADTDGAAGPVFGGATRERGLGACGVKESGEGFECQGAGEDD